MIVKMDAIDSGVNLSKIYLNKIQINKIYHSQNTGGKYKPMNIKKEPLIPSRVRKIEGGFSFIPNRFITGGFLLSLSMHEKLLYFLLVLTADREGLSYCSQDKMSTILEMSIDELIEARDGLIRKSLIAFNGLLFQLLSLPDKPLIDKQNKELKSREDFLEYDRLSVRQFLNKSLSEE